MTDESRVVIVTGGNRGIGLEVCRQLAQSGHRVVLTSRDIAKGKQAVESLQGLKADVLYYQLDVTSEYHILLLRDYIVREFGAPGALVNNAALNLDDEGHVRTLDLDTLRTTMETNVYGMLRLCQVFLPIMEAKKYGRIVNVSSSMGQWDNLSADAPAYRLSKVALNAVTLMLAEATHDKNVLVNAVDPGWVRTEMGGPDATRDVKQGADSIVWLATLPDGGPHGGFFRDRKQRSW